MTGDAAIVIEQVADQAGLPASARFRRPIEGTLTFSRWASAIDFLTRLGVQRGAVPGEFQYTNANRGSGTARLEGFDADEVRRIDDYFRIDQMRIRLGLPRSARQPLETRTFWTRPTTTHNPIPMIVLGSGILVLAIALGFASSVGPMRVPGDTVTWVYLPLFAGLALIAVAVIVLQARRLPAWFALRRAFLEAGEPLPTGLRARD